MARVRCTGSFDMNQVAEQFPGLLTFRGSPADTNGTTEIEGDVSEHDLRATIVHAATGTIDWLHAPTVLKPAPPPVAKKRAWVPYALASLPGAAALISRFL